MRIPTFLGLSAILSVLSLGAAAYDGDYGYYHARDVDEYVHPLVARHEYALSALEARQEREVAELLARHDYEFELLAARGPTKGVRAPAPRPPPTPPPTPPPPPAPGPGPPYPPPPYPPPPVPPRPPTPQHKKRK